MDLAPDAIDWLAIFSVIALFAVVLIYAYWPSNKKRFDKAAKSILRNEDKPRQQMNAILMP